MSENDNGGGGGGFGWGFFVGGLLGLVAGAYLASGPGREQVDQLRTQTIELTGPNSPMRARAKAAAGMARTAVSDPEHPLRRAVQDGVAAAKRRRAELDAERDAEEISPAAPVTPPVEG
ncbi:MAG TPA: hypothetical protein VF160_15400 [Candidatus Dormibacteraeota bacterium]